MDVLVAGEALVDVLPEPAGPRAGGGPFNAAIGLGRLGVPTGYLGRLSTDEGGQLLRAALERSGVDCSLAPITADPTTRALVTLDPNGTASYTFELDGTSFPGLSEADLPSPWPPGTTALHTGALALAVEPVADVIASLVARVPDDVVVSVDPNVRPAFVADRDRFLSLLDAILGRTDIVKLSDDDARWLVPGGHPLDIARRLNRRVPVVVLTLGSSGAVGFCRGSADPVVVAAPQIEVADTVGAGDAFASGLLARLHDDGLLQHGLLARLEPLALRRAISFAVTVSARTCERAGADPPWRHELEP